jgi:3D (Asp-Asp-Asp) domain-containing protein
VATTTAARRRLSHARGTLARQQLRLAAALSSARSAEASLEQTRNSRLAYIAQLRRQQQPTQVVSLVKQAQHIEQKAQTLQPPPPSNNGGGSPAPSGGRTMVVSATCYDLPGHTATGMPVGWGVIAVDPTVIPLGTKLYVPGYGKGVAADIGGAIKGAIIDLWMPWTSCEQWGRRTVTITVY